MDWNLVIKPLLSGSANSFTSDDAVAVIRTINEKLFYPYGTIRRACRSFSYSLVSATDILQHVSTYECFYSSFVALAGNMLTQSFASIPSDQLKPAISACQCMLEFCVSRIVDYDVQASQSAVTRNNFSNTIQCLCTKFELPRSDIITYSAMIKSAKLPPIVKNKHTTEENKENELETSSGKVQDKQKIIKIQSSDLFSCLSSDGKQLSSGTQLYEEKIDVEDVLFTTNVSALQDLAVKYSLFRSFLSLPYLLRYVNRHQTVISSKHDMKPLSLPLQPSDAVVVKNGLEQLLSNINLVVDATKLPIVDPLNPDQLVSHTDVIMSCFCACVSVAVAVTVIENNDSILASSAEMWESSAESIIKNGIDVYLSMKELLQKSSQFGGQVCQNFQLLALYYLTQGLDAIDRHLQTIESKKETLKSKGKKVSETLTIALSSLFVSELQELLDQCDASSRVLDHEKDASRFQTTVSLMQNNTPTQRFQFLTHHCNVIKLLSSSLYRSFEHVYKKRSYKKAAGEKHVTVSSKITVKQTVVDSGASEDEDAFGCCDEEGSEEFSSSDNESVKSESNDPGNLILGAWMIELMRSGEIDESKDDRKDVLVPTSQLPNVDSESQGSGTSGVDDTSKRSSGTDSLFHSFSTDSGVMLHFADILKLFDDGFLSSDNHIISRYFCEKFTDKMALDLSAIICVLDHDIALDGNEGVALMAFIQNLVTSNLLHKNRRLEISDILMSKSLILNPYKLQLGPKAMSIQAQTLLQQQQAAKDLESDSEAVMEFLSDVVDHFKAAGNVDLGVEVLQLTLFLFHTLTDNGKQRFLKKVSDSLIDMQHNTPLCVSRLMLIFDYLLHEYSEPSEELMQHVRWNFFAIHGVLQTAEPPRKLQTKQRYNALKKYTLFEGIADPSSASTAAKKKDLSVPPFFALVALCPKKANSEKEKGDTTAASDEKLQNVPSIFFDLRSKSILTDKQPDFDKFAITLLQEVCDDYDALYASLVLCLAPGSASNNSFRINLEKCTAKKKSKVWKEMPFMSAVAKYCFQLTWRVLKAIPPSEEFLEMMGKNTVICAADALVMCHQLTSELAMLDNVPMTEAPESSAAKKPEDTTEKQSQIISKLVQLTIQYLSKNFIVGQSGPNLFEVLVAESLIAQLQSMLRAKLGKEPAAADSSKFLSSAKSFLPCVLQTISKHSSLSRSLLIQLAQKEDPDTFSKVSSLAAMDVLLSNAQIDVARATKGTVVISVPAAINKILTQWSPYRKKCKDLREKVQCDTLDHTLSIYLKGLAMNTDETLDKDFVISFILLQESLYQLCDNLITWTKDAGPEMSTRVCSTLVPLLLDMTSSESCDQIKTSLEKVSGGKAGSNEFNDTINFHVVKGIYNIVVNHISTETGLPNPNVALEYLTYLEKSLHDPSMQRALHKFFVPEASEETKAEETEKPTSKTSKEDNITFKGNVGSEKGSVVELLLSNRMLPTPDYSNRLLQFIAKLCKTGNSSDAESCARLSPICSLLCTLDLDRAAMRSWVANFELDMVSSSGTSLKEELSNALLTLSHFLVSKKNESVQGLALSLLDAILPEDLSDEAAMHTIQIISPTFVVILATLANAENGKGHHRLFAYALWWLDACIKILNNEETAENVNSQNETKVSRVMATSTPLLLYVRDILQALKKSSDGEANDGDETDLDESTDALFEHECEFEDEDAQTVVAMEEDASQEEDGLWNKLCTYTITQKKFMNQHWYHCHTCDMVDGVGVCTICAKVCHKGHDLSYAKFGSFFCDCGAKEDKSCKAMVKRIPGSNKMASGMSAFSDSNPASASASAASSVVPASSTTSTVSQKPGAKSAAKSTHLSSPAQVVAERLQILVNKKGKLRKQSVTGSTVHVDGSREKLLALIHKQEAGAVDNIPPVAGLTAVLQGILTSMSKIVNSDSYKLNTASGTARALKAMDDMKKLNKTSSMVDSLMVPTLGSQEGAFENVKANFSGEQGQTIRQLINSRVVRRVAMCCLSASAGRRQHLAVSHEKGKVTLLQLSALLKQADASKRKLTLTRLSTTQMPFAVITITANPCNEEVLAVCGLKDCHILTFASSPQSTAPAGSVTQHLVLHPQLTTNNYIIRAVWLPAMPTMLALITADFIKIYDLAKDILSPCYYYLLPTGKIRDATFIGGKKDQHDTCLIVMSSTGHLYSQMLFEESLAIHGTFYLTNVLTVSHKSLKENGGQLGGGGTSVFYSHSLCLLFFSYSNGCNFAAGLNSSFDSLGNLFCITYKPSSGGNSSNRNGSSNSTTLYEWSEVVNHPGLVTCFSQAGGCPIVVMVEPEKISLQEIKATSNKAKIQDLVAVRHGSTAVGTDTSERTTVIVLCEDGSLRIYLASTEHTGYWLQPRLRPTMVLATFKRLKQSSPGASGKVKEGDTEGNVEFPIDFFEGCQVINNNDLEFGGDLLEVYNPAQIKNRLNSTGMYLMGKRIFNIAISQKNPNMVITGLRVLIGNQGGMKAPTYFYIEDRYICLGPRLNRARWFDLPLTRSESINNQMKVILTCGPSEDPNDYNILDSLKVYGKTKETFGWPADDTTADKKQGAAATKSSPGKNAAAGGSSDAESETSGLSDGVGEALPVSGVADEMLYACLTAVNCSLHDKFSALLYSRQDILKIVSQLLVQPLSSEVHSNIKKTLLKLFQAKVMSHKFQDGVLLENARKVLSAEGGIDEKSLDEEGFQRVLGHLSHIARHRPYNLAATRESLDKDDKTTVYDLESNEDIVIQVEAKPLATDSSVHIDLLKKMVAAFWRLLANKPRSKLLAPACLPGLTRIDVTVKAMIDVVHAMTATVDGSLETAASIYFDLLTCPNPRVSYAAKSALIKLLRMKQDQPSNISVMARSSSKMSETPPSTRSASPPSVTSSNKTGAIGRGFRVSDVASDRPGSHVSSRGTAGGTTDDADEDDDDDDDEEDDDDDNDDEDEFEHLANDDVAMAIEEQLLAGNETFEIESSSSTLRNSGDFFQQNVLPSSVTEAAASEYSRLLMSSQNNQAGPSSGESGGARLVESRSLTMDMMRAMAAEVARGEQGMNSEQQDIESMLMGVEFPNLLPPDPDDDEAMVEYAIALSLQQQEQQEQQAQRQSGQRGSPARSSLPIPVPVPLAHNRVRQHSLGGSSTASDTIDHSPNASHSIMDHAGQSLEPESLHAHFNEAVSVESISSEIKPSSVDIIGKEKLIELRLAILKKLFKRVEEIEKLGGEHCIPFFQVIASLSLTLNPLYQTHSDLLHKIISAVMARLKIGAYESSDKESIAHQTAVHEVHVIMMRLLSVLMSKSQSDTEGSVKSESNDRSSSEKATYSSIASHTAHILTQERIVDLCYHVLKILYQDHWKKQADSLKHKETSTATFNLLRSSHNSVTVDMSPFFLHQYVQSHAGAIFEPYMRLLTEMALNLTYQVRKQHSDVGLEIGSMFSRDWRQLLSEYMLFAGVPSLVRRRARKLLLYIAGSKEKYREERDLHALECYIKESSSLCSWSEEQRMSGLNLTYDELIQLVELIKKCCDIADSRNRNWQKYCIANSSCLPFLLDASVNADESVAVNALKLLLCAINPNQAHSATEKTRKSSKTSIKSVASSKEPKVVITKESKASVAMAKQLSQAIMNTIKDDAMLQFLRHFLLEMNTTSIRWSAHGLVHNLFKNSNPVAQEKLVKAMWNLWPLVATYGKKAAQFVDLLGFLTMNLGLTLDLANIYTEYTLTVLKKQNRLLSNHQNAILYSQLANYVQFDGYYLENNPCLVCNQAEMPFTHVKLSSIKGDTKYTTTQQIIKLIGSYTIQKITIKVTDIKRTKMIRTAVLYYNNKKVPAIVDLKNKPSMWHRAKSVTVPQGESEIRFDLPLPIIATNIMIEFTDFYENVSASIETLQCPRCSASVQANPGICSNCGENVFQCHKCRSINYDEKDPYLCNVCGFSKYAKFDVMVISKPCCAVESIENDEDRKKMVTAVGVLLEKADGVYNQLNAHKPQLETLMLQISQVYSESSLPFSSVPPPTTSATTTTKGGQGKVQQQITLTAGAATTASSQSSSVNSNIQQLAKRYCQECKTLFEELSGIMRTVLASRSEIVEYDKRQLLAVSEKATSDTKVRRVPSSSSSWCQSAPGCYGCASATSLQCITLLRVLATNEHAKPLLVSNNVIQELVSFNLRKTTSKARKQVHSLIGQLVKNNVEASSQLNRLLLSRVIGAVNHHGEDLPSSAVAYEIELLKAMLEVRDDLWQLRLKAVVELFQNVVQSKSPAVVETVTLPCTDMLRKLIDSQGPGKPSYAPLSVSCDKWLKSEPGHDFNSWKKRKEKVFGSDGDKVVEKEAARNLHLQEKYARKWKNFISKKKYQVPQAITLTKNSFLRQMLFCPSSASIRQVASLLIVSLAHNSARKPMILDLLTSFLDELGSAGESASRFLALYHEQIEPKQYRVHLAAKGALPLLGSLIQKEIAKLAELEETTLNLHLQQGYALKELIEILSEIVQVSYVRQHYKSSLVGTVLNSYLSLRRLVIQRTNLVDDAQDILLELLEELTTGTESETRAFMAVCIEAIKKQDLTDLKTPQFIFERLANIIYPEETDTSEFFLSLDKDPLQEDFLQGRMVGNPYSSNEPGLGPLMRDVKNKICRDCDLIALLEDDSGMEILVNNKIIALDLPVREVYKKVWLPNHNEDDAMHVVYRMRGLLGEATEDIIERLDSDKTDQDEEEVYKLASVLSECGGIEVMLSRLESVKSLLHGRQLVDVILKLLSHAVKLKVNRRYLARPKLNTLNTLLGTLNLGLQAGEDGVAMVDQVLQIMWSILEEAAADKTHQEKREEDVFTGDKEKLMLLLQQVDSEFVRSHTNILQGLLRIIPFLSFGDRELMQMLIDHFISVLNFEKYDENHSDDDTIYLNCFCEIVAGIQFNASGNQLKDLIVHNGIVQEALAYINKHIPEHRNYDSDDWKAFITRPALPFCLKMLTGLCQKHKLTQELVGKTAISGLHRLEQISSEGSIGSHAENVLEALQEHPDVAKQIKQVRKQTRAEKKKKAMEVRQQQLGALGMHTNEKGQVISKSTILQQISELVEESGLTCIICREGYKFEPKKVLGIYTYTRRCALEEFENKSRKQQGYSTVSHFNVVHYDCHTSAVRMARGREEWDSALLQNASTKCNGLLPLWGAQVPEAAFASCLARHNTYIQEATGQREAGFHSTVHDLKLLLLRFAQERSFSEETGGGGRQSNINLIPYLIHAGLYVINTTRNQSKEERIVSEFLTAGKEKWVESAYEVDGPLFVAAMLPFFYGPSKWKNDRQKVFDRIMVISQARSVSKSAVSVLTDRNVKEYSTYKPYLLFYALVELIILALFKHAPDDGGSSGLASYIRHNDSQLLETAEKMLLKFQDELLVCESLSEYVDVMEMHDVIGGDITDYLKRLFEGLPS